MKRLLLLFFIFIGPWMMGQELLNAYLEPSADPDVLTLNTVVWHYNVAGLLEYELITNGNQLEFRMCYGNGAATMETYDEQEFDIPLPGGFSNYEFQLNFYHIDSEGNCDYSEAFDTIDISFDYPYDPTATIAIPDPNFEGWLEYYGFGDSIPSNASVFAHRFVNICRLTMSEYDLSMLGLGLIEYLDGIQNLYRLKYLFADDNNFPIFDATLHPQLLRINVWGNPINDLDISGCPDLEFLVAGSSLGNIDLTQNPNLIHLVLNSPNITNINLSNNTELKHLSLGGMNITELDLSNNIFLTNLDIYDSALPTLIIPSQNDLYTLEISGNTNLSSLLMGSLPGLNLLTVKSHPELSTLDVNGCPNLTYLEAKDNNLETLDLSNQPLLEVVLLMNNQLQTINLKNGSNTLPLAIFGIDNPELDCVSVDFPQDAPYGQWLFDTNVTYSENCSLGIGEASLKEQIALYPNPINDILFIETSLEIQSVTLYDISGRRIHQYNNTREISLSSLSAGMYFIHLETLEGSLVQQLLKE